MIEGGQTCIPKHFSTLFRSFQEINLWDAATVDEFSTNAYSVLRKNKTCTILSPPPHIRTLNDGEDCDGNCTT
jgi:hypothetical protein